MRALAICFVLLTLFAVPAVAAADDAAPAPAAEAPATPAQCSLASALLGTAPIPLVDVGEAAFCSAQATCENGSTISCSCTSSSCTCEAVDQDCNNGVQGYVACGWDEAICNPCPPQCDWPPTSKCIDGHVCQPGCGHCGQGSCLHGTCNCLA